MKQEKLKKEKTIIKEHTDMYMRGWQVLALLEFVTLIILYPVDVEMSVEGNLNAHYFLPMEEYAIMEEYAMDPFSDVEYKTTANFSLDEIEGKLYLKTKVPLGVLLWQKYSED